MKHMVLSALALGGLCALPLFAQERKGGDDKPVPKPERVEPYKLGSTVDENITLHDLDGKELKFKDLRGKVVFIHFWSMTCPYEIAADPKTYALAERYKSKDVVCLAINSNVTEIGAETPKDPQESEAYTAIREHIAKKKMSFPVYADHGNVVADKFGAQHTPHCFVIDKKGVLRYAGGLDDDPKGDKGEEAKQYVRDAIEALLADKEPPTKESKPYGCSVKRVKAKS